MSGNAEWLERVIDAAQKEFDSWPKHKQESMQREATQEYFQEDYTSYGNF